MTEEQLRDILARVVPEAPDSAADPVPVVRAARARRRVQAVGVAGVAAALVVGTVVGVRAVDPDDDTQVVDQPPVSMADPYDTAPCPGLDSDWPNAAVADLDAVTAVRYCGRPLNGFDAAAGPADALVNDVSVFTAAVRSIAPADPGRCAAVDVMPTDSRLLFLLPDGSYVGVPAGMCQDAEVEGRVLDGNDLTSALLAAVDGQRDTHQYAAEDDDPVACTSLLTSHRWRRRASDSSPPPCARRRGRAGASRSSMPRASRPSTGPGRTQSLPPRRASPARPPTRRCPGSWPDPTGATWSASTSTTAGPWPSRATRPSGTPSGSRSTGSRSCPGSAGSTDLRSADSQRIPGTFERGTGVVMT